MRTRDTLFAFDVSPDGSSVSLEKWEGDSVRIYRLNGRPPWELRAPGWARFHSIDWSVDGKGVFVSSDNPRGSTLLYIDLQGHATALWQVSMGTFGIQSPDKRYLALLGATTDSHVWMIENF